VPYRSILALIDEKELETAMTKSFSTPLNPDKIKASLATKIIGKEIVVYSTTASTNDIAAEYAAGGKKNNGLAVFSECQTAGRGRRGNQWFSEAGTSIFCSILLTNFAVEAELLTLTAAVAVAETIGRCGRKEAQIKWPNDIVLKGKKVAGVMLESINANSYVLGIGINCNQNKRSFPKELRKIATSIDIESSGCCDRVSLARRLLTSIDQWLVIADEDSQEIINRWRQLSTLLGHRITIEFNSQQFCGNCIGIDPAKGLILQLERGGVRMFDAAHTTIVK
jgi:BirA family transcriptional regulator, biotin operon repressor / biotin---[acetyl-CoA-carboxylase] ligase